jgi:hypothetical protein
MGLRAVDDKGRAEVILDRTGTYVNGWMTCFSAERIRPYGVNFWRNSEPEPNRGPLRSATGSASMVNLKPHNRRRMPGFGATA